MLIRLRSVAVISVVVMLAVLAAASSPAQAQVEKPFKIVGVGAGPHGVPLPGEDPRPHWIIGNATYLGRHIGAGTVETDSADFGTEGLITGEFGSGSPFVFRGANGDRLVCNYGRTEFGASQPGTFELTILRQLDDGRLIVKALWIAEFVPVSDACTGKFAGVTGSWIMVAHSLPFVLGSTDPIYYAWEGEGKLTFQKKK